MAGKTGTCSVSITLAAIPLYGPDTCALLLLSSVPHSEPCWSSSCTLGSQAWRSARLQVQHSCVAQGQPLCWARCPCVVIPLPVIPHVYPTHWTEQQWLSSLPKPCPIFHPIGVGGLAGFFRALEWVSNSGVFQGIPLVSHSDTSRRHSCCTTAVWPGHTVSAPQRKIVVRSHALSYYTRTAGRSARGKTCTPTVIGLFC